MAIKYVDGSDSSVGRAVQIVTAQFTTVISVTSNAGLLNTDMYGSITPSSSSHKVLVTFSLGRISGPSDSVAARIRRTISGSYVNIGTHTGSGNWQQGSFQCYGKGPINEDHADGQTFMWLDSPNTTSNIDYRLQLYGQDNGTVYINRAQNTNDTNQPYAVRTGSSIILQEIAA
tara:strand:- start:335 stop:856 length:522 start_codon:yes stop_codon:yes gene_type:complete